VGDLLNELFSGSAEVMMDWFWDWLRVEQGDQEDWCSGVDRMDFVAAAADEGVLFRELLQCGGKGDPEDPACLGDHGRVLHNQLLVFLRVRDSGSLGGDLLCESAFGGSARTVGELRLGATTSRLHHHGLQRLPRFQQWGQGYR
jgi:hypothetical protein